MADINRRAVSISTAMSNNSMQKEAHNKLRVGDVYAVLVSDSTQQRPIFRLLHKNPKLDIAWAIQIPTNTDEKQHVKAPITIVLSELIMLSNEQKIIPIQVTDPPIYTMSDDEIREHYADKNGRCPMLTYRNERYAILEKLISCYSTEKILEQGLSTIWINEQATITKKSRAKLYAILHSYWAGNFSKNALLPDYWRSGGKGREREQKRKLGRPNAKVVAEGGANKGYCLTDADKKKLCLGWRYFLSEGRTRYQAYLETMAAFYSERLDLQEGRQLPILLHPDLRPTPAQFERWGPDGNPRLTASRMQLGDINWEKKYRGISGSAKDGITAVGMQAVCDTTTNDAYLKSVTSRIKTVGSVNRLLITESKSELIFGLHCGFGAPSAKTFLLAVAHGASNKVDFCARFGITIEEEDWPACVARTYLGDNGEYRNELSREALRQFGSSVDYIPSAQPQFNGIAESKHHLLHARLDHTLDGTTRGQPRRRGTPHPAINACVNYYEYMRELIVEVLYHNNEESVPHLLTAEMRREQVKPTRIAIYKWLLKKGYVVDFTPNLTKLHAHLYPAVPATLTESGVYLLREDRGNKDERIPHARYMGDCLIQSGLLEQARCKGNRRVYVRCNPTDPRSVWIQTELGLAELKNIHPDPILYRQATLEDLITLKDEDKVVELEDRGRDEQLRVEITTKRRAMLSQGQNQKKAEIAALPKPLNKADHYRDIDKNRQDESAHLVAEGCKPALQEFISPEISRATVETRLRGSPARPQQIGNIIQPGLTEELNDDEGINPALEALAHYIQEQNEK